MNKTLFGHNPLPKPKWTLVIYDAILIALVMLSLIFVAHYHIDILSIHIVICEICVLSVRYVMGAYRRVWRYGGASSYLHLFITDIAAGLVYYLIDRFILLPIDSSNKFAGKLYLPFNTIVCVVVLDLAAALFIRLVYRYLYQNGLPTNPMMEKLGKFIRFMTGFDVNNTTRKIETERNTNRINVAIVGAGRVGSALARELKSNPNSRLRPVCYIDNDPELVGRQVNDIIVLDESKIDEKTVREYDLSQAIFTINNLQEERQHEMVKLYTSLGLRVFVYDYPTMHQSGEEEKRTIRNFDIKELLFRSSKEIITDEIISFYRDKTVLITGGGGSIGSELCRQIARMRPRRIVIADVYENGAYDVQQDLHLTYGYHDPEVNVEILTVCDPNEVEKLFDKYKPEIVLHAAAHKHVPLMENNVCEAVKNNVFGTLNVARAAAKFKARKFIMVSTDKAVNPTNVMGATKRMCEMLVLSMNGSSETVFVCTRFGNVLGSNGSVIPLFKRQIEQGGPVTVTDKRIIRYFMTIPEASQLVLTSGAMARRGELFVLDMGKPVRILDLAENMIRLSGFVPYTEIEIVETGLRPGEKLYEELLIKTEELDKTENEQIFIEREVILTPDDISQKLHTLSEALKTNDDGAVKHALATVVPTFRKPEEVNQEALKSEEMHSVMQMKEQMKEGKQ